ncbi:hypothetical protein EHS13_18085 [Paenibacillus psychroresistens]|uniref:Uncharacterized protein n=1 Tax=Paenibacillus psychroresistens TaxID=1778678 RepID=A0A6B8RK52_9BACL|nr:hypothetical protein [Paenibacillus psychroresistens]QGQ96650.1 hypothetical protein EHS13_18085 [Paenibacillus psychroresistens]
MEYVRSVKIKTSFSFAVSLIDSYTSAPAIGKDHIVSIQGLTVKPIPKIDGYYIFTDLPIQSYQVVVQSKFYVQEIIEVSLDLLDSNEPILYVPLMPNSQYPFGEEATSLVALVKDAQENAVYQARARATVTSVECVKAKLAQDSKEESPDQIFLAQIAGKLTIGDRFLLQNSSGKSEYCRLVKVDEVTRCCSLEKPLQSTYEKGSLLFPVIESISDVKGEVLLFFKPNRIPTFGITLELTYGNKKLIQDLTLQQGVIKSLGIIRLVN